MNGKKETCKGTRSTMVLPLHLRLTAQWVHSGRIVIIDSGFASIKAAKVLAEVGLCSQWFSQKVVE